MTVAGRNTRSEDDLLEAVAGRAANVRLSLEAAAARGRMFLACPWLDPLSATEVVEAMVGLLEGAPAARTFRKTDDRLGGA